MNSQPTPNERQIRSSNITPPPELVRQWMERTEYDEHTWFYESYIAEQAARWGADQELEASCEYMQHEDFHGFAKELRAARRPKPPSLKEQALHEIAGVYNRDEIDDAAYDIIRRALEQLDD